jgi:GDP-D-mannose dehydratase
MTNPKTALITGITGQDGYIVHGIKRRARPMASAKSM